MDSAVNRISALEGFHSLPALKVAKRKRRCFRRPRHSTRLKILAPCLNGERMSPPPERASSLPVCISPISNRAPFIPIGRVFSSGERCGAVVVRITERGAVRLIAWAWVSVILHRLYPQQFRSRETSVLSDRPDTIQQLQAA